MERARNQGVEESRAGGSQTPVAIPATGAVGPRIEGRPRSTGLWDWAVDHLAGGRPDPTTNRAQVSSRTCVAHSALVGLELPAPGRSRDPTQRACDPTLETQTLA